MFAVLGDDVGVIKSREPAVVTFVQSPVFLHRQPEAVLLFEDEIKGLDRAGVQAGEAEIEVEIALGQEPAGSLRF